MLLFKEKSGLVNLYGRENIVLELWPFIFVNVAKR